MLRGKKRIVGLCIIFGHLLPVYGELLIVKKGARGYTTLSDRDIQKDGIAISEIVQKYSWPTSNASNHMMHEERELLSPGVPRQEENFIQKILDKRFGSDIYQVVFIPTTLYELFCIMQYYKTTSNKTFDSIEFKSYFLIKVSSNSRYPNVF
jgi:hypothetical protein